MRVQPEVKLFFGDWERPQKSGMPWPKTAAKIKEMIAGNRVASFASKLDEGDGRTPPYLRRNDTAACAAYQTSRLKMELSAATKQLGGAAAEVSERNPVLVRVHQPGMTALVEGVQKVPTSQGLSVLANAEYVCSGLDYAENPSKYLWSYFCTPVDIDGGKVVGACFAFREERAGQGFEIDDGSIERYNKEPVRVFRDVEQFCYDNAVAAFDDVREAIEEAAQTVKEQLSSWRYHRRTDALLDAASDIIGLLLQSIASRMESVMEQSYLDGYRLSDAAMRQGEGATE